MDVSKKHQALIRRLKKQMQELLRREEEGLKKLHAVIAKIRAFGNVYRAKVSNRILGQLGGAPRKAKKKRAKSKRPSTVKKSRTGRSRKR